MHLPPREDNIFSQIGPSHSPELNVLDPFMDLPEPNIQQPSELTGYQNQSRTENSISLDTRRLQTQHTTEGYRDGITAGKVQSIQPGFDQGFSLGANIGLKAGWILGLLEGVNRALKETADHNSAKVDQLLSDAVKELNIDSIFAEEYWASDGSWKYIVKGSKTDGQILFEDVADEHPIITKWKLLVHQETKKYVQT
ncbi:hypothetical protein F4804DRAFT_326628 [Jackrogersella minutella]|nr:hypothetical protein F4804DRAFT_326628 [Jackrogersella minutella]